MLSYYQAGEPANPTLILLHGGFLLHRMWMPQLEPLAQRYHVIAPDLTYDNLQDLTIARLAHDVSAFISQDQPVFLVGLSLGAIVATQIAIDHPQSVQGMILSAGRVRSRWGDRAVPLLMQLMPETTLFNGFLSSTLDVYPALDGAAQEDLARIGKAGFVQSLKAMQSFDFTAALPSLQMPVLVTVGAEDRPGFIVDAQQLKEAIPNATLQIIRDVGHGWNLEAPEKFTEMVVDFVEAHRHDTPRLK